MFSNNLQPNMNTTSRQLLLFLFVIVCPLCSCKDSKRRNDALRIVGEWTGKEILFPENLPCYVAGKDTLPELCNEYFNKEFKILMYVDSAGCSSCRLKLFEWQQLIDEADSLFHGKVGFLLYFQPKNVREMRYLFVRDRFNYPIFMDIENTINRLNRFPREMEYQCFLLNRENKVLMIGNPTLNQKVWELYKSQISGKSVEQTILTTIEIDKTIHNYGTIPKGSSNSAVFSITNTGNYPLIIFHVSTSCGCTNVNWDKQPVELMQTVNIHVEMTPDETGYFSKTLEVYCNIQESSFKLIVDGSAHE